MQLFTTGGLRFASLPALTAGIIFSGVALTFNVTYGYSAGGASTARCVGFAVMMIGCLILKDIMPGQAMLAFKERRHGWGSLCIIGAIIGAAFSFLAALGSASDGQAEKSGIA